jgi:signal transduction histidine kinase
VTLDTLGVPFALSEAAELTVFRIVQEALTNALKHAESARSVHISLTFADPEVTVLVADDGRSQSAKGSSGAGHANGHGVLGMAERAAAFDGSLVAGPRSDGGWQVAVTLRGCKAPALL